METKIMIVDDEPDIRAAVCTILEASGYGVLPVESGARCIEELEKGFRGVILMDVMMPEMDGWATTKKAIGKGLLEGNVVAMLTAKEDPDADLEEVAETVVNYIRKPFKPDMLVSTVGRYCRWLERDRNAHLAG